MYPPKLARDIMVTDLVTFSPEEDVFDSIKILLKRRITGGPVVDRQRHYLGVFSEKRCLRVLTRVIRAAEQEPSRVIRRPLAKEFMTTRLLTLSPESDAFDAIGYLLKNHISGAPVVDADGRFLGVFSEKTSMSVLIQAAYEQLPTTRVSAFMNTDLGRTVSEELDLLSSAEVFLTTPYRRLPVLRDGKLVGQISRRDVLQSQCSLVCGLSDRYRLLLAADQARAGDEAEAAGMESPAAQRAVVGEFLDADARVIDEDLDLLGIAQVFLNTPYRRLPVVAKGKLLGQVSRRDLLHATHELFEQAPQRENPLLYLSALKERHESPI